MVARGLRVPRPEGVTVTRSRGVLAVVGSFAAVATLLGMAGLASRPAFEALLVFAAAIALALTRTPRRS